MLKSVTFDSKAGEKLTIPSLETNVRMTEDSLAKCNRFQEDKHRASKMSKISKVVENGPSHQKVQQ